MVNKAIDYNEEYKEHKRCPNCNRKTAGIEDYKNIRSGNITRTCKKCRECVYKSFKKKPRFQKKKVTLKEIVGTFSDILEDMDKEQLKKIVEKHPEYRPSIEFLIDI
jgi:hypothetical protein